ncbi:MAG: signal peptidase I [Akkermansia sp.]
MPKAPTHSLCTMLIYPVIDHLFAWVLPKWRSRAREILKGSQRYLNYKYDLLPEEQVVEIQTRINNLRQSLRSWDQKKIGEACGKLESLIDSMPDTKQSSLAENVEVFFVILVIFLGLRCYIAQPFRIPTGSMQPSLNGIVITPCDDEPSLPGRIANAILHGTSYVNEVATDRQQIIEYKQGTKFLLLTRTTLVFDNGTHLDIPAAQGEVARYFLRTKGTTTPSFNPGETIMKATCDAGDLIIVNKIAYHFRQPQRGEVFVFDTLGIEGIHQRLGEQARGSHYVKRLCGLPGDTLSIQSPLLLVDGKNPDSWTIRRVEACQPPYNPEGYVPASRENPGIRIVRGEKGYEKIPVIYHQYLTAGQNFPLRNPLTNPNMRQYAALGDNTLNSLDSRYWGAVHQYNIVGPASFALWPFTNHWGLIP